MVAEHISPWLGLMLGKPSRPPNTVAIGKNMVAIILIAVGVLLFAAVLVLFGYQDQKGPHGRGGPFGPDY